MCSHKRPGGRRHAGMNLAVAHFCPCASCTCPSISTRRVLQLAAAFTRLSLYLRARGAGSIERIDHDSRAAHASGVSRPRSAPMSARCPTSSSSRRPWRVAHRSRSSYQTSMSRAAATRWWRDVHGRAACRCRSAPRAVHSLYNLARLRPTFLDTPRASRRTRSNFSLNSPKLSSAHPAFPFCLGCHGVLLLVIGQRPAFRGIVSDEDLLDQDGSAARSVRPDDDARSLAYHAQRPARERRRYRIRARLRRRADAHRDAHDEDARAARQPRAVRAARARHAEPAPGQRCARP